MKSKTGPQASTPDLTGDITILTGQTPIAGGTVRQVWDRPGHPTQILKTIRPGKIKKFANRNRLHRAIDDIRLGPYRSFRIEYWYYSRTAYKCLKAGRRNPIAEIGGLAMTDHGLAQVCEKVMDATGALAKPLKALVEGGTLNDNHVQWLNELIETIYSLNISVPDLSNENIVFDEVKNRFFVIDGFGDKAKVPMRSWFRSMNQKKLDDRCGRMAKAGFLTWDPVQKTFSLS